MEENKVTVKELFSKNADDISQFLGGIYEHSRWVAEALVKKGDVCSSLATVSDLAAAMKMIVDEATNEMKVELLCAHPDLCEKVGKMVDLTKESQEEQSRAGLHSLTDDELERFTKTNTAYKEKFKFPFILAVRNATKYTVLSALEGRLPKPAEKEFVCALEQVHKIAFMRLLSQLNTEDALGFLTCHILDTANGCPGKFTFLQDLLLQQFGRRSMFGSLLFLCFIFSCQNENSSPQVSSAGISWFSR
jgi:2-oxo-4-hydroxy-4-carboxy-5-ureidoimidazoline decarboxylase